MERVLRRWNGARGRLGAVLAAALLLVGLPPAEGGAQDTLDPAARSSPPPAPTLLDQARRDAEQARQDAEAAQARLDAIVQRQREVQVQLDRAVGNFEGRRSQYDRLDRAEAIVAGELERLRARTATTSAARDAFIRTLYKRPASALYTWAMSEREIGDAIHRGLMVGYVLDASATHLREAERLEQELLSRSDEVDTVRQDVTVALEELTVAQAQLEALLREVAALERSARQLVATSSARATELEVVASQLVDAQQHCPIGVPNSFVDTWGAPRSGGRRHQGVDIFAPEGTELYAAAGGVVSRTATLALGGITLHLDAVNGDRYYYAHLSAYAAGIAPGTRVRPGQLIGYVGRTGNARTTPPHLHWEHHPGGGVAVNPYPLAAQLCR